MERNNDPRGYLLEDFRLFHLNSAPGEQIDYHYHQFHKLFFLLHGSGSYFVEQDQYALQDGDLVLIGSHTVHKPDFHAPYERIILYISPEFLRNRSTETCDLEALFSDPASPVIRPRNISDIQASVNQLEQALASPGFGRDLLSEALLLQLLVQIGRCCSAENSLSPSPVICKNTRILEIMRYIDDHLREDLSIDQLSDQFFISKYHMMRAFRQETGITIHNYILERRLFLARTLIHQGIHATEACYSAGFRSYSSFTRAYGQRFGCTPTGRSIPGVAAEETFE